LDGHYAVVFGSPFLCRSVRVAAPAFISLNSLSSATFFFPASIPSFACLFSFDRQFLLNNWPAVCPPTARLFPTCSNAYWRGFFLHTVVLFSVLVLLSSFSLSPSHFFLGCL